MASQGFNALSNFGCTLVPKLQVAVFRNPGLEPNPS